MRYYPWIPILLLLMLFSAVHPVWAAGPDGDERTVLSLSAVEGMTDIPLAVVEAKENLSYARQKIGQDLLERSARALLSAGGGEERIVRAVSEPVSVYVVLRPGADTAPAEAYLKTVSGRDTGAGLVAGDMDPADLEALAGLDAVVSVTSVLPPQVRSGVPLSEGDAILRADEFRAATGYGGAGMKIGIISDGVDHIADPIASGNLPADVVVLRNAVGGDEGTAMLEIVHDLAPDATLYFHDCGSNPIQFNAAIDALADAGCTVICDDIGWLLEPFFEDGYVGGHVADLIAERDVLYVSSAGNAADQHYQGLFYDNGAGLHDFSHGTSAYQSLYASVPRGGSLITVLQWDDSWGASGNDYDLYLFDYDTGIELANSTRWQSGSQDPLEYFVYTNPGGGTKKVRVAVDLYSGSPRTLELYLYPSGGSFLYIDNLVEADSIFGHPAVDGAIGVGAIRYSSPESIEYFSSRGPVTVIQPSSTERQKPDICGIDGVSVTGAGDFPSTFYGTSASAPHVAAVSALVWGLLDTLTADEIADLLTGSAVDLGDAGWDPTFGYGRADAMAMYLQGISPPSAAFSADITAGDPPLAVTFTDASSGYPTAFEWDFGDDATSTDQSPVHTYTEAGVYTVSLTVSNLEGEDTLTRPGYIIVGGGAVHPVANFTANTTSGVPPLTVAFTDLSENSPSSWLWDFGDGSSSSDPEPVHQYTTTGSFNVTLTVENAAGNDTLIKPGYITVVPPSEVVPFPGSSLLPTDPDGDDLYEDVNGNGRIDFGDVVTYFRNMVWIETHEPLPLFDYNMNTRVDFGDVILLFRML